MPKAAKIETLSHQAAVQYLRTVLPTYAPGTRSKNGKFQDDHWKKISEALSVLEAQPQSTEGNSEASTASDSRSAKVAPAPKMAHCVRCHAEFDTKSGGSCEIPHVFNEDPSLSGYDGDEKVYEYKATCCKGPVARERGAGNDDFLEWDGEACVEEEHTTDAEEAHYNGQNIVKCKIGKNGKCMMECLDMEEAELRPLFACNVHRARYSK